MSDDFFRGLSPETLTLVEKILAEPLRPSAMLREQVVDYSAKIASLMPDENIDFELAIAIRNSCLKMLETLDSDVSESHHRFVQLACRYFVEEEDEEGDLDSVLGFGDDAEVLNLVAGQLGMPELKVSSLPR